MLQESTSILQCRRCDWRILMPWKDKKGKIVDSWKAMVDHYLSKHDLMESQVKAILDDGER